MTPNDNNNSHPLSHPVDPRLRNTDPAPNSARSSPDITNTATDMFREHVKLVETECSGLFSTYMALYKADPSSPKTKTALDTFNARYDHLKKLQGILNDRPEEEPQAKKEQENEPLAVPKSLLFLQLQDDNSSIEKRPYSKVYQTTRDFCNAFERMLSDSKLSVSKDWERILPLCLNQEDKKWFESTLLGKKHQWKDARQSLIDYKQTGLSRLIMMMDLCQLSQGADESVRSYGYKYQTLCKEAHVKDGSMLATQFLVSLQKPLQRSVLAAVEGGKSMPRTLPDMVQLAIDNDNKSSYKLKRLYDDRASESPSKKIPRDKTNPCRWCGNPFTSKHKCQEFYDRFKTR